MKIAFVWDVTQCSVVDRRQCFRETSCLHLPTLKMEAAHVSEVLNDQPNYTVSHLRR
jgi:hypothetical protein